MTILYPHQDRRHGAAGRSSNASSWRALARRAIRRTGVAFVIMHRAIVIAKTRRLRRELMLHRIPQQPLILGDKWDF